MLHLNSIGLVAGLLLYACYFITRRLSITREVAFSRSPFRFSSPTLRNLTSARPIIEPKIAPAELNYSVAISAKQNRAATELSSQQSQESLRKTEISAISQTNITPKPIFDLLSSDTKSCITMLSTYGVDPGNSWGTLPLDKQRNWSSLKCDDLVSTAIARFGNDALHLPGVAPKKDPAQSVHHESTDHESNSAFVEDVGKSSNPGSPGLPRIKDEFKEWCQINKDKYHVQPMKSWGNLPMNMIDMWKNRKCDLVFTSLRMGRREVSSCLSGESPSNHGAEAKPKSKGFLFSKLQELLPIAENATSRHANMDKKLPLISTLAGTTTRRVKNPSTKNMALSTYLLPSLIRSLDCGFRYEYVLGYDKGDPFYDTDEGLKEVKIWFQNNVEIPLRQRAISFTLRTVKVRNTIRKPGPVFIEMARQAYHGGANYFFRVNDDTEVLNNWPRAFASALSSLSEPYGVVGPLCRQGNQGILTHDFVHRIHMEIFDMNYYPPELPDWWMDDWISWVYGQSRTFKAQNHPVIHHTGAHGQRYEVDRSHEHLVSDLVKKGRMKIRQWMLKHNIDHHALKKFDSDIYQPGYKLLDVPAS